jgi:hypothetical protein
MKENKFKNISDIDLAVIIKAQSHHSDYLEAMKEYISRQGIKEKKTKRRLNLAIYLQIIGLIFTFILLYFAIFVSVYKFPVPFIRSSQPKPDTQIPSPKPDYEKSNNQNMNQKVTKPHKSPKYEPKKTPSQPVTPPDR